MPRVNVWIPEELHRTALTKLGPNVGWSGILQDGIRDRLTCFHDTLGCMACNVEIDHLALIGDWLYEFFAAYMRRLEPLVKACGTAEGAARIMKDHALSWQTSGVMSARAERFPLPRPSRQNREEATPARAAAAMPPMGLDDWALGPPALRRHREDDRRRAEARRRRNKENEQV